MSLPICLPGIYHTTDLIALFECLQYIHVHNVMATMNPCVIGILAGTGGSCDQDQIDDTEAPPVTKLDNPMVDN